MIEADVFQTPLDEQVPSPPPKKKGKLGIFEKQFVEDTIKIRTANFGKGILIPQGKSQSNQPLMGKKGTFSVGMIAYDLNVRYAVNLNSVYTTLDISYNYDDGSSFCRSQSVRLVMHELYFGTGWSFVCNMCNKPCKTLFLPRGDSFFACRSCKSVHYGKCYFKPHIEYHKPLYGMNRYNKVISNYPDYKRYTYNKKPTKKFLNTYKLYLKEGVKFSDNMTALMKKYDIGWELRDFVFKHGLCS